MVARQVALFRRAWSSKLLPPVDKKLANLIAAAFQRNEAQEIGQGGSGQVFKVKINETCLAVKTAGDMDYGAGLLENEARALAFINSAYRNGIFSAFYGFGVINLKGKDQDCLVMGFLPGQTLDQSLHSIWEKRKALSFLTVLGLLRAIAQQACLLHVIGLVHRDIKTANVMLHGSGNKVLVRLFDFGLTRPAGELLPIENSCPYVLGTPEILSLGMWQKNPPQITDDLFSLAQIFVCLLGYKALIETAGEAVLPHPAYTTYRSVYQCEEYYKKTLPRAVSIFFNSYLPSEQAVFAWNLFSKMTGQEQAQPYGSCQPLIDDLSSYIALLKM